MKLPAWVNTLILKPSTTTGSPKFDISLFKATIDNIKNGDKHVKIEAIKKIIEFDGLIKHHTDKHTSKLVLAECEDFEYDHEHHTSKKLTAQNYHVVFTPKGYFKRQDKKHDVFLFRNHIMLEVDLKCIYSKNPDTIDKRIKEGSEQAQRVVLDIHADIERDPLINGLRLGCQRNDLIIQILLFYKSQFYLLQKDQILGKNIYNIIK